MKINFDNSYLQLPERFYRSQPPAPVTGPALLRLNEPLAAELGLDKDWLTSDEGIKVLAGNHWPEGAAGIATAYAGHQFGSFNPQLGDGRAVLLGEVVAEDGERYDIQLKGSGPTAFSRGGDGRAPLGPVLREYIVSEAMHALGVPTSRSLAAVLSGDTVYREEALPGAVLTRVARSHIRIGTVQFFAFQGDWDAVRLLADHVIARHYPAAREAERPYFALFEAIIAAQAALVAKWQALGFIHGVMNTDNMLLSGETIDYGPCAFMDTYHPATVFSSIDAGGRYAYQNQPGIAQWNLMCLAQALLPLIDETQDKAVELAKEALDRFPALFRDEHFSLMAEKLGIVDPGPDDEALVRDLLSAMEAAELDYTLTFRQLGGVSAGGEVPEALAGWLPRWQARVNGQDAAARMAQVNPIYIPRNHRVEAVITAALTEDYQPFRDLLALLADPYTEQAAGAGYELPPRPDEVVRQTFCGT